MARSSASVHRPLTIRHRPSLRRAYRRRPPPKQMRAHIRTDSQHRTSGCGSQIRACLVPRRAGSVWTSRTDRSNTLSWRIARCDRSSWPGGRLIIKNFEFAQVSVRVRSSSSSRLPLGESRARRLPRELTWLSRARPANRKKQRCS